MKKAPDKPSLPLDRLIYTKCQLSKPQGTIVRGRTEKDEGRGEGKEE
jgi:hypothetical protein